MLISGEEPFLLDYKIEVKSSTLKLELLKSLEIPGAEGRLFKGGNGASQKISHKDCILELFSDDLSHVSLNLGLEQIYLLHMDSLKLPH